MKLKLKPVIFIRGAVCISEYAKSVSGLKVNSFVGVLFNDTLNF